MTTDLTLWLTRAAVSLAVVYAALFAIVTIAMLQTPERFGAFMKRMPMLLVWGAVPGTRLWLWARRGALRVGDPAPDFSLRSLRDRSRRVSLSSHRGARPVVLVFGSYT